MGAMGTALISVWAGETVKFSHGTKRVTLPDSIHQGLDFERFSPNQRSRGEVETPTYLDIPSHSINSGTSIKNKKLQDYIDQRLNWIFVTPDSSSSTMTTEEAFGIRKSSFEEPNQKKKVVQKFMEGVQNEGKKEKKDESKRFTDDDDDELSGKNKDKSLSSLNSSQSNGKASDKASDKATDKNYRSMNSVSFSSMREYDDSTAGILPENSTGDSSFDAILKGSSALKDEKIAQGGGSAWKPGQDFQQILRPTKVIASINGPNDPVNQAGDTSRSSLQPVVGGLDSMDRFSTRSDSMIKMGAINRSAFGGSDDYSSRIFGSSSLSPAMITPPTPIIQPKSSILEIPKRKF